MAASTWKGHLTFGLVSLPVRLFTAARGETISFNQLHKEDNSRVKQVLYCQAEDKPITRDQIVKGYEYEKGKYVVIDDEDIRKAAPKTAKVMEILEFVKGEDVDPVYLDTSYYMAPDEGGEKPYALLFAASEENGLLRRGEGGNAQSQPTSSSCVRASMACCFTPCISPMKYARPKSSAPKPRTSVRRNWRSL